MNKTLDWFRSLQRNSQVLIISLISIVCFFAGSIFGNGGGTVTPTRTPRPTATARPSATPHYHPPINCIPNKEPITVQVERIIDGDTIEVSVVGGLERVRLIGIDTPERGEPGFTEASNYLASLIDGRSVLLWQDVSDRDRYDRLLAYVTIGDLFVNLDLVRRGYAKPYRYAPDTSCAQIFDNEYEPLIPTRPPTRVPPTPTIRIIIVPPTQPPQSNCHPSYVGVCLQIGIDYDCAGGSGNGPLYISGPFQVVGWDEYRLDGDHDGWACE